MEFKIIQKKLRFNKRTHRLERIEVIEDTINIPNDVLQEIQENLDKTLKKRLEDRN